MGLMDVMQKRRAYRSLGPAEINGALVDELARAASLAASCFNKQPWRFVFAFDRGVLDGLKEAMNEGNEWTHAASLIVAVCSRRDLDCVVQGREYYLFDTGMATACLILRATEMGLVAHPIAGFDQEKAREVLGIPVDMTLITLVIVGRHLLPPNALLSEKQAAIEAQRPERLPLAEILRRNRF
ncbi:MAG: nitroreductase family protein [Candidatus Aminicenantes bacterium]|nr:nitroreductase family protein [Candidatus Aminicenantes bacterium]